MYYRLNDNIALRRWRYVDRAIYFKDEDCAASVSKDEFEILLLCDGNHDLKGSFIIDNLVKRRYIERCEQGKEPSEWSKLKTYDNLYFPRMNLMITGKCNLNCLHCFNAKDNAPLNSELSFENILSILDQASEIGVHGFTLTGGEPLVHKRFLDIVKAIYERNMMVFELNTNGLLLTQEMLDTFKEIGCNPLIKISYDGVGYHNWIRQHPKAEELTIKAIELCIKNGFRVKAQVQVNRKNVDVMMKTAVMLNEMGVYEMRIIRTTEAPRWEKNSPQSSLAIEEYYEKMLSFAAEYMKSGMQMRVDIWQFMRLSAARGSYELVPIACDKNKFNLRIPMCKGNRGMIAVSSGGEVVPCLQMSGYFLEKGISLCNCLKTPLRDLVQDSDYVNLATAPVLKQILENDKCANCRYYKACNGGCPALGLLYSKDVNFYHEDITKCAFFENGWYERCLKGMEGFQLNNPLDID
ncbi:MAG: radical SAM protein [Bacilli bacterium]|nr:radical SAM protein [Bacilli bacterium]